MFNPARIAAIAPSATTSGTSVSHTPCARFTPPIRSHSCVIARISDCITRGANSLSPSPRPEATSTCPIDIRSSSSVFVSYVHKRSALHKRQCFPFEQVIIRMGASTRSLSHATSFGTGKEKGPSLKTSRAVIKAICGIVISSATLSAQTVQAPPTASTSTPAAAFDVVSVKPSDPKDLSTRWGPGKDSYTMTGASLKFIIMNAYDLHDFQIEGAPAWINSARFDILAKMDT